MPKNCLFCSTELEDNAVCCHACGAPQVCRKCGLATITPSMQFCPGCAAPLWEEQVEIEIDSSSAESSPESPAVTVAESSQEGPAATVAESSQEGPAVTVAESSPEGPAVTVDDFAQRLAAYEEQIPAFLKNLRQSNIYTFSKDDLSILCKEYDAALFKAYATYYEIYNGIVASIPQNIGDFQVEPKVVEARYARFYQENWRSLRSIHACIEALKQCFGQLELIESRKRLQKAKEFGSNALAVVSTVLSGGTNLLTAGPAAIVRNQSSRAQLQVADSSISRVQQRIAEDMEILQDALASVEKALSDFMRSRFLTEMPAVLADLVNGLISKGGAREKLADINSWWQPPEILLALIPSKPVYMRIDASEKNSTAVSSSEINTASAPAFSGTASAPAFSDTASTSAFSDTASDSTLSATSSFSTPPSNESSWTEKKQPRPKKFSRVAIIVICILLISFIRACANSRPY